MSGATKTDNWEKQRKAIMKQLRKSLGVVGEDWLDEAKKILSKGRIGSQAGGGLQQQFDSRVLFGAGSVTVRVSNSAEHAAVIHQGWASEKANPKMPPIDALAQWVEQTQKINVKGPAARGIAFTIARKMQEQRSFLSPALRRRPEAPDGGARFFELPLKKKYHKWSKYAAEQAGLNYSRT